MKLKNIIFLSLLASLMGAALFFSSENEKCSSVSISNIGTVDSTSNLYSREFRAKEFTVSAPNASTTVCSKKNHEVSYSFSPTTILSSIPTYKWEKQINILTKRCEALVRSKIIYSIGNLRI